MIISWVIKLYKTFSIRRIVFYLGYSKTFLVFFLIHLSCSLVKLISLPPWGSPLREYRSTKALSWCCSTIAKKGFWFWLILNIFNILPLDNIWVGFKLRSVTLWGLLALNSLTTIFRSFFSTFFWLIRIIH